VRYGHAERLAAHGFRVIMPDLRGHGDSAKPHDPAAYPPDVLTDDGLALIESLELADYDLGGYSLGARTTVRLLARGATPRRAIVAGMGLEGIVDSQGRGEFFRRVLNNPGSFPRASAEWMVEAFLKTVGGDPVALLAVLDAAVDTPQEAIGRIEIPVLVAAGAGDSDNGSAAALARAFARGRYVELPGNHMSTVARPELGMAMAEFLG
jgi:pimeloyl-ACP methyl ester carboxylesterase